MGTVMIDFNIDIKYKFKGEEREVSRNIHKFIVTTEEEPWEVFGTRANEATSNPYRVMKLLMTRAKAITAWTLDLDDDGRPIAFLEDDGLITLPCENRGSPTLIQLKNGSMRPNLKTLFNAYAVLIGGYDGLTALNDVFQDEEIRKKLLNMVFYPSVGFNEPEVEGVVEILDVKMGVTGSTTFDDDSMFGKI